MSVSFLSLAGQSRIDRHPACPDKEAQKIPTKVSVDQLGRDPVGISNCSDSRRRSDRMHTGWQ